MNLDITTGVMTLAGLLLAGLGVWQTIRSQRANEALKASEASQKPKAKSEV